MLLKWVYTNIGYPADAYVSDFPVDCFTDFVNVVSVMENESADIIRDFMVGEIAQHEPRSPIVKRYW